MVHIELYKLLDSIQNFNIKNINMIDNNLKSLLANMSAGEIQSLLAEIKRYASASATVDSLKRVFRSGHILEFQMENGDFTLVDDLIEVEPVGENKILAIFSLFGVTNNIKLCVQLNTTNEWVLNKANPIYCFNEIAPTLLIFNNGSSSEGGSGDGTGAVSVAVCKYQRGVYDELCKTAPEVSRSDLLSKIVSEPEKCACGYDPKPAQSDIKDAVAGNEVILMHVFDKISDWLKTENRRVVLDISRSFTFEDRYSSSRTHNNFSLAFKCVNVDWIDNTAKFGDCSSNKSDFLVKTNDFINGSITWEEHRKNLLITSEDKSYIIRISFMDGAKIVDLNDDSMNIIKSFINISE